MNIVAFSGALELGFLYGIVALGIYLSFRVLDFPDLTVDGSFPLGGAIAATLMMQGVDPIAATIAATIAGALAGLCTAALNIRFKILNLLASILTMIALYSINLRIMGKANIAILDKPTLFKAFNDLIKNLPEPIPSFGSAILLGVLAIGLKLILDYFLKSQLGLAMRATGANPTMAQAQGISTGNLILLGMAIANAFAALGGALFAQLNGFADIGMGIGTIIFGLAAVIVGEAVFDRLSITQATIGAILGSIVYRIVVAIALSLDFLGLQAQDLNLITAVLVTIALILPNRIAKLYQNSNSKFKN
jgi:putative tryptophan/tyrosine transport system permease protein